LVYTLLFEPIKFYENLFQFRGNQSIFTGRFDQSREVMNEHSDDYTKRKAWYAILDAAYIYI
jgi:hypothetical protein